MRGHDDIAYVLMWAIYLPESGYNVALFRSTLSVLVKRWIIEPFQRYDPQEKV